MFLSIDAGNSNIVFGFYIPESNAWAFEYREETKKDISIYQLERKLHLFCLENNIKPSMVNAAGISSVVPEINETLKKFVHSCFNITAHFINERSYIPLAVKVANPIEMGTDLIANAEAAYNHYSAACIVVDFGTALTFTVLDDTGKILGVNIVPGLKTAIKSLFRETAKLPEVKLKLPQSAIGKNTIHSIQAGILYGYTGLVKGMIQSIKDETGLNFKIIATGGLSAILTNLEDTFDTVDRKLTLKGIKLITEKNP